jgi:uncharacterized protein with GYD domain
VLGKRKSRSSYGGLQKEEPWVVGNPDFFSIAERDSPFVLTRLGITRFRSIYSIG